MPNFLKPLLNVLFIIMVLATPKTYSISPQDSSYRFDQLDNPDQFSHIVITDIIQDSKGFIWIGTEDGLNKFDGVNNTIYRPQATQSKSLNHFFISSLYLDKKDILWIGTEKGLNYYDESTDSFGNLSGYNHNNIDLEKLKVTTIYEDSDENIWFGTRKKGVYLIDKKYKTIKNIDIISRKKKQELPYIYRFYKDKKQRLYISTAHGLREYNLKTSTFRPYLIYSKKEPIKLKITNISNVSSNVDLLSTENGIYFLYDFKQVKKIFSDDFKNKEITKTLKIGKSLFLVGTRTNGLYLINIQTQKVQQFVQQNYDKYSIVNNEISKIYQTKDGVLWIGTNIGINTLNQKKRYFGHIIPNKNISSCFKGKIIYSIFKDSKSILWVAGSGKGLNKINLNSFECDFIDSITVNNKKIDFKEIVSTFEDINGDMWFATYEAGLIQYLRETNSYILHSVKKYGKKNFSSDSILNITDDYTGNIWFSTFSAGLIKYNIKSKKFTHIQPQINNDASSKVGTINAVSAGVSTTLWLGTQNYGLLRYDWEIDKTSVITPKNGIIPPTILSIDITKDGIIWLGTRGYGSIRFDPHTKKIITFNTDNFLSSNTVMNTVFDSEDNIWLYTDLGLTKINKNLDNSYTYLESDGLQANAFTDTGFFDLQENKLWTGGINGFNIISLDKIPDYQLEFKPVLTDFILNPNSHEAVNLKTLISFNKQIDMDNAVVLEYDQNNFSFSFSAMEFERAKHVQYTFKLDGYDNWKTPKHSTTYANYTNIPPGKYEFKVKTHLPPSKSSKETSIKIIISPPWWHTSTAYFIFVIIGISFFYFTLKFRTNLLIKRATLLENQVKIRTNELAKEKFKVEQLLSQKNEEMANISHEFRTPLTLIIGPISKIITSNSHLESTLTIVQRNAFRLLRMIEQLLDIESFRVKNITQKSTQDFGKIAKMLVDAFKDLADEKMITIKVINIEAISFEFTPDALEKIILNLISNAIKYTPAGGTIFVETQKMASDFTLTISDTGIGISPENQKKVFNRYHRIIDQNSEQITGAGIGLSLVKNLVEAHGGKINLTSELNKGTTVKVTLPIINEKEKKLFYKNNKLVDMEIMSLRSQKREFTSQSEAYNNSENEKNNHILIIEDNIDMQNYISDNLKDAYKLSIANNGVEGIQLAQNEVPDLIICDIMMPLKDGYETTQELRINPITNHIPIILLTARSDRESRLRGWHEKADEYLTKPFDVEELNLRVINLLEIRDILKKSFSESLFSESQSKNPNFKTNTPENIYNTKFVQNINKAIEKLYKDPNLSVLTIASEVAMSERQLFRKMKNTLDLTPSEYLRRYRLEKSKELLLLGKSINFVTFEVGFSSQSYFGKCFKAQYHLSPSEYKKSR